MLQGVSSHENIYLYIWEFSGVLLKASETTDRCLLHSISLRVESVKWSMNLGHSNGIPATAKSTAHQHTWFKAWCANDMRCHARVMRWCKVQMIFNWMRLDEANDFRTGIRSTKANRSNNNDCLNQSIFHRRSHSAPLMPQCTDACLCDTNGRAYRMRHSLITGLLSVAWT